MSKKINGFEQSSPARKGWVLGLIGISVAIVATTERDIQRRGAEEVRGSKWLWRLVCLNAVGCAVYFRWGRRPA
jgi:hypothetical protein